MTRMDADGGHIETDIMGRLDPFVMLITLINAHRYELGY
jgi:hypothetical protein